MRSLTIALLLFSMTAFAGPKYAADVHPLSADHKYLESHAAPDYWRLAPYYVPQINGAACSAASFAMIINAGRSKLNLTADDKLVTQLTLADQLKDQYWGKAILDASHLSQDELIARFKSGALTRSPIWMREYDSVVKPLLEKNGLTVVETRWLHVTDTSAQMKQKIRELLIQNEKSDSDFVVIDVVQGDLTGDPDGMVAHVAVIGAFDEEHDKVLIMDPDREWYEPYWTTLDRLVTGTSKIESTTHDHRGLYYLKYEAKKVSSGS